MTTAVPYAAFGHSYRAMRMADYKAMESAARAGMTWTQRAGDDSVRLMAHRQLAQALVYLGDPDAGIALA